MSGPDKPSTADKQGAGQTHKHALKGNTGSTDQTPCKKPKGQGSLLRLWTVVGRLTEPEVRAEAHEGEMMQRDCSWHQHGA